GNKAAAGHLRRNVLRNAEELAGETRSPPPEPQHALTPEVTRAGFADIVNVFRVDDHGDSHGSSRRAGVEERSDLVRVEHVGMQDAECCFHLAPGLQPDPRLLADTDQARPQGFCLRRQGSGAFEADHGYLLAQLTALAYEINHNAFQSTG